MIELSRLAARIPFREAASLRREREFWEELEDLRLQMDAAFNQFEMLADEELIEACCWRLKALSLQYGRMLREARRKGIRREPY